MNPFTSLTAHAVLLMFLWLPFAIGAAFADRPVALRATRRVRRERTAPIGAAPLPT